VGAESHARDDPINVEPLDWEKFNQARANESGRVVATQSCSWSYQNYQRLCDISGVGMRPSRDAVAEMISANLLRPQPVVAEQTTEIRLSMRFVRNQVRP
jgi:hypothetical protein